MYGRFDISGCQGTLLVMSRRRNSHIQLQLCQLYFDKWSPDLSDYCSLFNKETIFKPNMENTLKIHENTLNKHIQTCSTFLRNLKAKTILCHTEITWNNDNDNVMQSSITPNLVRGSKVETSPRRERRDGIDVLVILGEWTASKGSTKGPSAQWHSARAITPKLCNKNYQCSHLSTNNCLYFVVSQCFSTRKSLVTSPLSTGFVLPSVSPCSRGRYVGNDSAGFWAKYATQKWLVTAPRCLANSNSTVSSLQLR